MYKAVLCTQVNSLVIAILLSIFSGCSDSAFKVSRLELSSLGVFNINNPYKAQAINIIQTNCTSCHTSTAGPASIYNLTDPYHLMNTGLIVPGLPSVSPLYSTVAVRMHPTNPLSAADKLVIFNWIKAMATPPTPGVSLSCAFNADTVASGSSRTAYQTPTVPAGQTCVSQLRTCTNGVLSGAYTFSSCAEIAFPVGTFKSLQAGIFNARCISCHSAAKLSGGFAWDTYAGVLRGVNIATPTASKIYIQTQSGNMPKGGPPLSAAEVAEILQWITAGALNN